MLDSEIVSTLDGEPQDAQNKALIGFLVIFTLLVVLIKTFLGSSGNRLFSRMLTRSVLYKVKADHFWLTLY